MKNIKDLLEVATTQFNNSFVSKEFSLMVPKNGNFEYETKVDILDSDDLEKTLNKVKALTVLKFEHRSEYHHLFEIGEGAVLCLVLIKNLAQVWIKIKSNTRVEIIGVHRIPFILREGDKFKPEDSGYKNAYKKIGSGKYFKSYNKECINYFFRYEELFYSLSLSLAYDQNNFRHTQMEFEYEGYLHGTKVPDKIDIMNNLEALLKNNFSYLLGRFSSETKYESLKSLNKY